MVAAIALSTSRVGRSTTPIVAAARLTPCATVNAVRTLTMSAAAGDQPLTGSQAPPGARR